MNALVKVKPVIGNNSQDCGLKKTFKKVLTVKSHRDILIHVLSERMKQMSSTRRQKVKNR